MEINIFVENIKGSNQKYELDEETNRICLDRVFYSSMFWPFDYGFIEETEGEDNDPLDVVLLSSSPSFPGCIVKARAVGVLMMEDEAGVDHKIIAVPDEKIDPRFKEVKEAENLPSHFKAEMRDFFETYKRLEPNKWVKVKELKGRKEAERIIEEARQRYNKK